ncbi:MAG TPA: DUF6580 family putative transport protein [Acidisarcina sp.]|nr:DUF6580 family putative transport protein [Acidisarcina sp.]
MSSFLLILLAIASRVLPHTWWNFTAVGGSLLYFGARRPLRQAIVPLVLMACTDYYLTVYAYNYAFHVQGYLLTWVWYAAAILLGRILLRDQVSLARGGAATLLSATSFFAISNYAVWAGSGMYPHSIAGLAACYTAALPFYRNDLISTALVLGVAFGLPALARHLLTPEKHHVSA